MQTAPHSPNVMHGHHYNKSHKLVPNTMNPARQKVLRGMSLAMSNHMGHTPPPKGMKESDVLSWRADQGRIARELNQEFINRSRGKGRA